MEFEPRFLQRARKISQIIFEGPDTRTVFFEDELCSSAKPGQFVMLWVPGVDEFPLSLSHIGRKSGVTVKKVGKGTSALFELKPGDYIGVRGPLGNFFKVEGRRALVVAGGVGAAPLLALTAELVKNNVKTHVVLGAKSKSLLLFYEKFKQLTGGEITATTENGSFGIKGEIVGVIEPLLRQTRPDVIYACGKEKMLRYIYDLAKRENIEVQFSLERYMRCGIGVCGSCHLGKYLVCKDGPIFSSSMLKEVENKFGQVPVS